MDGLLIVDKPSGPTSHDVVARMRRALREKRIGHTGTLDPMATGVLLLVVGKATRLAKFLTACDKSYDAVVRFGFATDTGDAQGEPVGPVKSTHAPSPDAINAALDAYRGTFMQQTPAFSAKKINGQRSYKAARARRHRGQVSDTAAGVAVSALGSDTAAAVAVSALGSDTGAGVAVSALPAPARVTGHHLEILSIEADCVTLRVDCSAGFYIRSLAHDLGERLGIGAHLAALRRTRVGDFGLDRAVTLDAIERDGPGTAGELVTLRDMLSDAASVTLTADAVVRALHGRDLWPGELLQNSAPLTPQLFAELLSQPIVKLLDPHGELVAVAQPTGAHGILHPSVVLV
jgi:tRNA pseudouridine55 synthase